MPGVLAFGSYLPDEILTNAELAARIGCDAQWIVEVSGIEERRIAAEGQSVADLACAAARNCLSKAKVEARELQMLIVSSGSSERRFPGPAAVVGRELGVESMPCLDVPIASAGSIFALSLAGRLVDKRGPILVIAAEKMSRIAFGNEPDKNTAILFGDGAGACIVTPDEGKLMLVDSVLHSDGAFADDLYLVSDGRFFMNGRSVIMQASRKLPAVITELLTTHSIAADQIAVFLVHQANQNLILRVAKAVNVDAGRFYSNIARYGNTSSASMLIAAAEYFGGTDLPSGAHICFAGFGAGFHWGAVLAEVT